MGAKYQYRIFTESKWQSQSGNAILVLYNPTGSGKKIGIQNIEIYNNTKIGNAVTIDTQAPYTANAILSKVVTLGSGDDIPVSKMDTANADVPTTIKIQTRAGFSNDNLNLITRVPVYKNYSTANLALLHTNLGHSFNFSPFGCVWEKGYNSALQQITIRPSEKIALYFEPTLVIPNQPIFVEAIFKINSITYSTFFFTNVVGDYNSIFSVDNGSASDIVYLQSITVSELGTYDTPYFQIVPVGLLDPNVFTDDTRKISVVKTDTNHPDLATNICKIFTDAPILPYGVPVSYISEGSPGSPKGFNYLNTKDFIGPTYAVFFPEAAHVKLGTSSTTLTPTTFGTTNSQSLSSIKGKNAPLMIREGEGIAICSGAETATGTLPVGVASWGSYEFGITLTVESAVNPYLTLNGLVANSDIIILNAGTSTSYQDIDSYSGTSWSWNYDPDFVTIIDICVYKSGYKPFTIRNLSVGNNGATIPIQQQIDLNYNNPV